MEILPQIIIYFLITLSATSFVCYLGARFSVIYPVAFMACLIPIAQVLSNKLVLVGPYAIPAGTLLFSMSFLVTDVLSEKWGKKYAQIGVWAGFIGAITLIISLYIVLSWGAPAFAQEKSEIFESALSLTPRIFLAGFIAYLISEHLDVLLFSKLKKATDGKHLWLRNNLSTIISQFINTILFITIAFYGVAPIFPLIVGQYFIKVLIAICDTPFIYLIIRFLKNIENDKQTKM